MLPRRGPRIRVLRSHKSCATLPGRLVYCGLGGLQPTCAFKLSETFTTTTRNCFHRSTNLPGHLMAPLHRVAITFPSFPPLLFLVTHKSCATPPGAAETFPEILQFSCCKGVALGVHPTKTELVPTMAIKACLLAEWYAWHVPRPICCSDSTPYCRNSPTNLRTKRQSYSFILKQGAVFASVVQDCYRDCDPAFKSFDPPSPAPYLPEGRCVTALKLCRAPPNMCI